MIFGIEYIGIRLSAERRSIGLTQKRLGELSGMSKADIQKIEDGKSIQPVKIMEIAEVLDVNPAWLQFGEPWARKERPTFPAAPPPRRLAQDRG